MKDLDKRIGQKKERIKRKLLRLYKEQADEVFEGLMKMMIYYSIHIPEEIKKIPILRFSEKTCILITYGDTIKNKNKPLRRLSNFCMQHLRDIIESVHILPFHSYSSDKGFSIIDYKNVDPSLGDWNDVKAFSKEFKLMFDLVLTNCSQENEWFHQFLIGNPYFTDFFIAFDSEEEINEEYVKLIQRPRETPLLHKCKTGYGDKYVWTTFSKDQVDLNWKNPEVFLAMIDILLFYVQKGMKIVRLDAVSFLWKELGTECVNLPENHTVVQLMRDVLDVVSPDVNIITETNVSHKENIRYFGDGNNEAQMVYNFALPPLVLYTFLTEDAGLLTEWIRSLKGVSGIFFNFLDSHDGIMLNAVKGILDKEAIEFMGDKVMERGGRISYSSASNGKVPYELNTTWWNAVNGDPSTENMEIQIKKYLASRNIALVMKGVPGIYIHGLLGTTNDYPGLLDAMGQSIHDTDENRFINRKEYMEEELLKLLEDENLHIHHVFHNMCSLLRKRRGEKAFHPYGEQKIIDSNPQVVSLVRHDLDFKNSIVCLTNISSREQMVRLNLTDLEVNNNQLHDIITDVPVNTKKVKLEPFQFLWLKNSMID
ncbi:MAG: sugar phosphorylase [Proteobacteria bacterium]|nr:sugar phosphorylase [Pseudomonadota bacterium]